MLMCDLIGCIRYDGRDLKVILKRHGNISEHEPKLLRICSDLSLQEPNVFIYLDASVSASRQMVHAYLVVADVGIMLLGFC